MLEIRHLKTLKALRESGSLVEAAERLCLTQSALSHQLKELESRIGVRLFIRKTRPLRFTEPGKRLLQLADDVAELVTIAQRDIHKLVHGEAGRLSMAIECHSCFNWLMPTVDRFRNQWPSVELDFSGGFTFDPLPALVSGEVDLVITSDPVAIKGISYQPLFVYEMQIAVSKDNPLVEKAYLLPSDLFDQTLIVYPVELSRLDVFKRFLTPANYSPAETRSAELTMMKLQLVASNRGISALPNWVLHDYTENPLIAIKQAGTEGVWPTLYAAVRESSVALPYLKDFLIQAREHCFKHLPGIKKPENVNDYFNGG